MPSYGIRAVGFANGAPCPHADLWLRSFDFENGGGRGYGVFTPEAKHARKFTNQGEALTFWRTQSKTKPFREDGEPNRPLTSLTVCIEELKA
jgi:hypothetical protein